MKDLLGTKLSPGKDFPPDEEAQGFNNNAGLLGVSQILSDRYLDAAEALAREAIAEPAKLLPCDPATAGEEACAGEFIASFGKRAFRRTLSPAEVERFHAVYVSGSSRGGFNKGIELVIEAALVSPSFLYRVELGTPDPSIEKGVVKLSPYEVATRLSFLLWGSMPDEALFHAADAGELSSPEQVAAQARRMLDDPRARAVVADFSAQWLDLGQLEELSRDPELYPKWSGKTRALMAEETRRFINDVVFDGDGRVETLFTASYSLMNKELADFYGVEGPEGEAFERVELDPRQRAGVLTQASFLATHAHPEQTSPVERGKVIRERILCESLPPPPPDLVIMPPDVEEGVTTREKFRQHSEDPACSGCHQLMDPVGLGLEHLDPVGRWRDDQYGIPIDATGEVKANPAVKGREGDASTGEFDGAVELASQLAQSEAVRSCLVTQWFRYGYGRSESQEDQCTLAELKLALENSGNDVRELLVALTQTEAFMYRHAATSEGGSQ